MPRRFRTLLVLILPALALVGALAQPAPAQAQGGGFSISQGIVGNLSSAACRENGDCGWCDLVDLMVVLQKTILYLFGGLALVMIIWGGFGIVSAAGNAEKIAGNKKLIVSTLFGILIILTAYFVISVTVTILTQPTGGTLPYAPLTEAWWKGTLNCYTPQDGDSYCSTAAEGSLCYKSGEPFVCNKGGKCNANACQSATAGLASNQAQCMDISQPACNAPGNSTTERRANCQEPDCKLNVCPGGSSNVCCQAVASCTGVPDTTPCQNVASAVCISGSCQLTCAGAQTFDPSSSYSCQATCGPVSVLTTFYCPSGLQPFCCKL